MQCVILAAGVGSRMLHLTEERPKPLIPVLGVPIIERIARAFPPEVDEFIVVIGYKGDMIRKEIKTLAGERARFVEQDRPLGTFHALSCARHLLKPGERFFVANGDDILSSKAIAECIDYSNALVVKEVADPRPYGVVECDLYSRITSIEEKPAEPKSNLVSAGVYLLDETIFDYEPKPSGPKNEIYLSNAIAAKSLVDPVFAVTADEWISLTCPDDVLRYERALQAKEK